VADVVRDRWAWARRAQTELRDKLAGLADPDGVADIAHVLLVGNTQVGKTTLLLWMLGVTQPQELKEADRVLRAGQGEARSATAAPIRYCWSGDADTWLLVHGRSRQRKWLAADEMLERLASFRSPNGGGSTWQVGDPPLEIGLPGCLAGAESRDNLRVLDVPGLYASDEREQAIARRIITRAAPSMSLIVFVVLANHPPALLQPEITENPHLQAWRDDPDRFRIVLTSTLNQASISKELMSTFREAPPDSRVIVDYLRDHVLEQLGDSTASGIDPDRLRHILFPVEIGKSLENLDPDYLALVGEANNALLTELRETLTRESSEDERYLSVASLEHRIESLIHSRQAAREASLTALNAAYETARDDTESAERQLRKATELWDQANAAMRAAADGAAALKSRSLRNNRPKKPAMRTEENQECQKDEKKALFDAAAELWYFWRQGAVPDTFPRVLPPGFESRLSVHYDELVDCRGECDHRPLFRVLRSVNGPDYCYAKMTKALTATQTWAVAQMVAHVAPAVNDTKAHLERALEQVARARSVLDFRREELARAATAWTDADTAAERERERENTDLETAHAAVSIYAWHNQDYVRAQLHRAGKSPSEERLLLVLAALRAVYDLDRIRERG
jgi:hypothetical protein